jgi:hypothetical protein
MISFDGVIHFVDPTQWFAFFNVNAPAGAYRLEVRLFLNGVQVGIDQQNGLTPAVAAISLVPPANPNAIPKNGFTVLLDTPPNFTPAVRMFPLPLITTILIPGVTAAPPTPLPNGLFRWLTTFPNLAPNQDYRIVANASATPPGGGPPTHVGDFLDVKTGP